MFCSLEIDFKYGCVAGGSIVCYRIRGWYFEDWRDRVRKNHCKCRMRLMHGKCGAVRVFFPYIISTQMTDIISALSLNNCQRSKKWRRISSMSIHVASSLPDKVQINRKTLLSWDLLQELCYWERKIDMLLIPKFAYFDSCAEWRRRFLAQGLVRTWRKLSSHHEGPHKT